MSEHNHQAKEIDPESPIKSDHPIPVPAWNEDPAAVRKVVVGVLIGLGVIIALGIISNFLPKTNVSSSPSTKTDNKPVEKTQPATAPAQPSKPMTIEDKLWQAVDVGLKKRDNVKVSYDAKSKVAFIETTNVNPFTAEGFVRQSYAVLVLFGQEAFKIDGVDSVNVQHKTIFTDEYGKQGVDTGVIIDMGKTNFSKFEWKNLEYQQVNTRIQAASNVYIIKPAIQSEIKDPSKLYLVLHYP